MDILLGFMGLRKEAEEKLSQELRRVRSITSYSVSRHITGRGSYRHRQMSIVKINDPKDPTVPVILEEGTPAAQP